MCNSHNAIFTMINWFSKYVQFVPCMITVDDKAIAHLFFDN